MTDHFNFPEIDEVGIENLDAISFAPGFNEYMYKTILPYCEGKILEIGTGTANISKHFIQDGADIHLSDIRENYLQDLKEKYPHLSNKIHKVNLVDQDFDKKNIDHFRSYDTVFALNVIEHIKDDNLAVLNAGKMLKNGGRVVILVPAYQWMYNSFDTALEHYRRYTGKSLKDLLSPHMKVIHQQYFNVFGMLGWFISGRILKKKTIPRNQMELYDRLIFISRILDKLVINKIGLSVIAVAQKSD